ncbi:MAG: hypothetical protein LBD99_00910 [Candidatus Margulisbacteria bacterium]|jgi:hypothetical protein|nr:hypothetical protein [Candidatus Margulisiibacteriota bacterium]
MSRVKQKTKKCAARIVEKSVRAPALVNRKLENFKKLLVKNLQPKAKPEKTIETIVDAALVSEFTPNIRKREYYAHMKQTITGALLKNKTLKKEALEISKGYQKLLG